MARYSVVFRKSVAKALRAIPADDVKRILARIETLAEDPRGPGCEKLTGSSFYHLRQGLYRIVYAIEDDILIVTVIRVAHRRDVYRGM